MAEDKNEPKDLKEALAVIAELRSDKDGLEEKVGELDAKCDEFIKERDEAKDELDASNTKVAKLSKELDEAQDDKAKLRAAAEKANVKFGYTFAEAPQGLTSVSLDGQSVKANKEGVWKLTARQAELAADHGLKPVRVAEKPKK